MRSRRGASVVYTSLYDPQDCVGCTAELKYQVLYVESYISESLSSGGGTNGMDVLMSDAAYITHLSRNTNGL